MLFEPYQLGRITLRNRLVMAPMTRNRTTPAHVPTLIMARCHAQRATNGLIIIEGTAPAADGPYSGSVPRRAGGSVEAGDGGRACRRWAHLRAADLVARLQSGAALNAPDVATFYTPGEKGYTDYPTLPV